jgi:hypothetical protein
MTRAARRIFLETGDEIRDESQFVRNAVVYVSSGEDFNDPYAKTKELIDKRKSVLWKSDGLRFLAATADKEERDEERNNSRLGKKTRFTKRLAVFENGSEFNPSLVVMETVGPLLRENLLEDEVERIENGFLSDFLEECSSRMKMASGARLVFNWEGMQVSSLLDIPKLDKCIQPFVNDVEFSPVWVTKGEGFYARSALMYLDTLLKTVRGHQRELVRTRMKIARNMDAVQKENFKSTQLRLTEMQENIDSLNTDIAELQKSLDTLSQVQAKLQALTDEQSSEGYTSLFKHIKNMNTNERIFGGLSSKGIKLKVLVNGRSDSFDLFFNTKTWFSDDEQIKRSNFAQLLDEINRAFAKHSRSYATKFTRLFKENGEEIASLNKLNTNDVVWVSPGEPWSGERVAPTVVSINVAPLIVMNPPQGQQQGGSLNQIAELAADIASDIKKFVLIFLMIFTSVL